MPFWFNNRWETENTFYKYNSYHIIFFFPFWKKAKYSTNLKVNYSVDVTSLQDTNCLIECLIAILILKTPRHVNLAILVILNKLNKTLFVLAVLKDISERNRDGSVTSGEGFGYSLRYKVYLQKVAATESDHCRSPNLRSLRGHTKVLCSYLQREFIDFYTSIPDGSTVSNLHKKPRTASSSSLPSEERSAARLLTDPDSSVSSSSSSSDSCLGSETIRKLLRFLGIYDSFNALFSI